MKKSKEVDYYYEIRVDFVKQLEANLAANYYVVTPLIGEISSGLRTLIVNGHDVGKLL